MQSPVLKTFNPKNKTSKFEFYILCKGLNSGKPLETPCPNSFVCICRNQIQRDYFYTICLTLWKSNFLHQNLIGSVIPYIRINDFKKIMLQQAEHIQPNEIKFQKDVETVKLMELKEKQFLQNLQLLSEMKRTILYRHLRQF